ncbi:leucyl/phenylalanyl-tRNA--protein transferase [Luteimonas vadosa]|uniref:Leucyl/phenylalanyl-tRNA--protein transferase n=1 Tax=Luteimonas vadosa TaxID=1165507 RepID=A0ABP9E2R1_9GAMM
MSVHLPRLGEDPGSPFPPPSSALERPNGLLAFGGDLTPARLLNAYALGIFPWFSDGQPILWWSPDPRMVFETQGVQLSSRFQRGLRNCTWVARADTAFDAVVRACATVPRRGQEGTWITAGMQDAYRELHRMGHAHSVEVFDGDVLAGGIYGVALGRMFFGESMFSARSGGSKVALAALAHALHLWGWPLIDAQVENEHLERLGARRLRRDQFIGRLRDLVRSTQAPPGSWTTRFGTLAASELASGARPRPDE